MLFLVILKNMPIIKESPLMKYPQAFLINALKAFGFIDNIARLKIILLLQKPKPSLKPMADSTRNPKKSPVLEAIAPPSSSASNGGSSVVGEGEPVGSGLSWWEEKLKKGGKKKLGGKESDGEASEGDVGAATVSRRSDQRNDVPPWKVGLQVVRTQ